MHPHRPAQNTTTTSFPIIKFGVRALSHLCLLYILPLNPKQIAPSITPLTPRSLRYHPLPSVPRCFYVTSDWVCFAHTCPPHDEGRLSAFRLPIPV